MKRTVLASSFALLVLLLGARPIGAEPNAAMEKDIRELMAVTGSAKIAEQVMDALAGSLGKSNPKIPQSFWKEMKKRIKTDDFFQMVIPIYTRHLSAEDVKAMLAFYKTPAGQRVVKAMPAITQESMAIGNAWGQKIAREVIQEARERGYGI